MEPPPRRVVAAPLARIWAFARRESIELARDKLRLAFAIIGPIVLLLAAAWSVSFDVENVRFAVLDRDQSLAGRELLEQFAGSRYFVPAGSAYDETQARYVLRAASASLVGSAASASTAASAAQHDDDGYRCRTHHDRDRRRPPRRPASQLRERCVRDRRDGAGSV